MSSIQSLREFFNERLNTFAEDIFRVFERTIVECEEEISRQRTLLDVVWKPAVQLDRIELPLQYSCEEDEVLTGQQLCNQERNFSLDQEDPEPPQIKEEQGELSSSQDREQLVVKQENNTLMLHLTSEEGDNSEDQTLYFNPDESQSAAEKAFVNNTSVKSSQVPGRNTGHLLLSHSPHFTENQDRKAGKHGHSESSKRAETKRQRTPYTNNKIHSNSVLNSTMSTIPSNIQTGKKSFKCDTCGKVFKEKSKLIRHLIIHTGLKPYSCNICGKKFNQTSIMQVHRKTHTGEKPFSCNICSKRFGQASVLKIHKRIHSGEKPHSCNICGKRFGQISSLKTHKRIHTGERPYSCEVCGKGFTRTSALNVHLKTHTGEKPYSCKTCGKCLRTSTGLTIHMRTHTGEKPYSCSTCGNRFSDRSILKRHMRRHTGVKPHLCNTCGKRFYEATDLKRHSRIHTDEKSCS